MVLSTLAAGGCSDDPETKAAQTARKQTAEAVRASVEEGDYAAAQQKVMAALVQNRPEGLTRDAALLASGNLALAKGRQMQADLGLEMLPLNRRVELLARTLRRAEDLLVEKERIEGLLASDEQEVAQLRQILAGEEGLQTQLDQAGARMTELRSQREAAQAEKNKTQAALDEYQAQADALLRQAETAGGDEKLALQQKAYAILQQRKDYYIQIQAAENAIANLDDQAELVQVHLDGINRSIQEIQQRIAAVESSENRTALKQQTGQIAEQISVSQQELAEMAAAIKTGFAAYEEKTRKICAVFEEAAAEFEKIHSGDAGFASTVCLAESVHRAALADAALVKIQVDLAERFKNLTDTADAALITVLQERFPVQPQVQPDSKQKIAGLFDRAIETYEKALSEAERLGPAAVCSVLKSQLLAHHDKMRFADICGDVDLANAAETAMMEVVQKGTEKGICFTQSEALKIVESDGLGYLPSLPLNMEVFIEGKKQEFTAWKQLPLDQQEAAVDALIPQIDALIAQYAQQVSEALEPLRKEMLDAKERGFKEPAPGEGAAPGEPNSLP
ncbi:MAG: hypothetical protein L0Y36_10430 [Planctomycetales bacterium]|nr:hypothetical protein [Planctomycetales bacterium]